MSRSTLQALAKAETLPFEDQDVTAMDQPVQEGRRHALFAGIARQARARFGIAARQVHVDTTSFAVTGEYAPGEPEL